VPKQYHNEIIYVLETRTLVPTKTNILNVS